MCRRPHQSLAAVGVAALTRLISAAGSAMSDDTWALCVHTLSAAALDTLPQVGTEVVVAHVVLSQHLLLKQLRTCWLNASPTKRALAPAQVGELVAGGSVRTSVDAAPSEDGQQRRPSLASGSGARRLGLVRPHPAPSGQCSAQCTAAQQCSRASVLRDAARLEAGLDMSRSLRPSVSLSPVPVSMGVPPEGLQLRW